MRLRQVEDLLDALTEADAEDAAGAHPDHRLHDLEAGALRVVPRIQEREEARAAIGLHPDRERAERTGDRHRTEERAGRRAGDDEHPDQHHHQCDRGSHVGLEDQQHAEDGGERSDWAPQLAQVARRRTP